MLKNISKKKVLIVAIILLILIGVFFVRQTFAMTYYQVVNFSTGLVTASTLNVRQGPSTNYKNITTVNKNEYVRVFAQIGSWYVIQTNNDYVGCVSTKYIKPIYPNSNNSGNTSSGNKTNTGTVTSSDLTSDELEVFNLVNQQRTNAGLSALKIDNEVQKVARDKAKDMVNRGYFSHTSPTYGSPFDMLKSYGVSYKSAGENLAGNSTNSGAVNAWMNSEGHRANILNNSFNYTGVAVVSSNKYGKIYVQMFIGK